MTTQAMLVANRYELGRPLGRGSFGQTFVARDLTTGRSVAVKILDPREAPDLKVMELFEREAAVLRELRHQGIPEIFDVARAEWKGAMATLIVMEYVEGESLAEIIDTKRSFDAGDVMHLFLEMLGILEYIHGRVPQILHRDIKPSNIIVRPNGSPALVDFGSARREFKRSEEAGSTVAGTYGYMPYEQYMGQATPSSDLFALAATFLHLLTGRPPRDFMSEAGSIEVPSPLPGDERLAPILQRMLKHSPNDRYPMARAVRQVTMPGVGSSLARVAPIATGLAAPDGRFLELGVAPRQLEGRLKVLVAELSPGAMAMMSAGEDTAPGGRSILDWMSLAFFSLLTAGTLPIMFIGLARARRRKIRHFIEHGIPATARVDQILVEKGPFEVPHVKVSFSFNAEGRINRGADIVLPSQADRWRVDDDIQVLYDPRRGYSAVIISTS